MTFFVLRYSKLLLSRLFFFFFSNLQDDITDQHCTTLIRKTPLIVDLHYCTFSFTFAEKESSSHCEGQFTITASMARHFTKNSLYGSQTIRANIYLGKQESSIEN